ncbi:MAG TPA: ABC transporter permease [Blastocatellia bacterium]|nr:ABC transporter permease [Blastocatellia bacterium]
METLLQDLRYAVRVLMAKPAFTAVAIITLALGIGANTAIFSIVNAVLLRPLPYKDPSRLVMLWETIPENRLGIDRVSPAVAEFLNWRVQNKSFDGMIALVSDSLNLTGTGEPQKITGARVSANFFDLMGVQPRLGSGFTLEQDHPGSNYVVVISDGFWKRQFGADPAVIGKNIILDEHSYTIVGVAPTGFQFPRSTDMPSYLKFPPQTDLWTPIAFTQGQIEATGDRYLAVIARLKPGMTLEQSKADMDILVNPPDQRTAGDNTSALVVPLQEQMVGSIRPALIILLISVVFVLLISCANVANLMLARSLARRREIAIRIALGASRGRVIRQLLTESLLLSLLGGIAGALLDFWAIGLLIRFSPKNIPRLEEVNTDARVLVFTLVISILTGLIFGVVPALQTSSMGSAESLKDAARGSTGSVATNRGRSFLVVAEIALSLVLLVGAGLLIRSFMLLMDVKPGFNTSNILTMSLSLPETRYPDGRHQKAFFEQVVDNVRQLPGVESAAVASSPPFSGIQEYGAFLVEGHPPASLNDVPIADRHRVGTDYFQLMGMRLIKGRFFNQDDIQNNRENYIVSESLARQFFPNEDPVGKHMMQGNPAAPRDWSTIVGVVDDVKQNALEKESRPTIYMPYSIRWADSMTLLVHTKTDPNALTASIRNAISQVDKEEPIADVRLLEDSLSDSTRLRRFNMTCLAVFAGVALILAVVGIYGVMSYSVTQRTQEIGIRMALGAQTSDVLKTILGRAMLLTAMGITAGLIAALFLTGLMTSLLYGVGATDLTTFAAVTFLLTAVAALAGYLPARRATKVDPMIALRYE